jgi:hypothetical protein
LFASTFKFPVLVALAVRPVRIPWVLTISKSDLSLVEWSRGDGSGGCHGLGGN